MTYLIGMESPFSARGCEKLAPYWIVYPSPSGTATQSRRCRVHAREYAERHGLVLPAEAAVV